jgi:hypothetical protein
MIKTKLDAHYFICGNYMEGTMSVLEDYINDVIKMPYPRPVMSAEVRTSKEVAGLLGMKKNHATTVLVDKKTKDKLAKQFSFDNTTLGALPFTKYKEWVLAGKK